MPAHWNAALMQATARLKVEGGPAILSAWRKTGWCPLNRHAQNYPPELYLASVTVDPRGSARLGASAPQVNALRSKLDSSLFQRGADLMHMASLLSFKKEPT